ncbi:MAG: inositol monophosphatase/fructose,6-bisphosphatase family protein [Candidatus Saccharibacteria bacterium]|nr:inositol monophosphatase/fructose,6-bisphosphatase family protein [Candidatus Saccharibacteria bacterium]
MTDSTYDRDLTVATEIAYMAGNIMLQYFDGDQQKVIKHDGSPVTIADTLINTMVIERLAVAFPDDGVIGEEESSEDTNQERVWLCDPIDGTKAYVWGTPTAMFSLALVVSGKPIVGVAYDPFLKRLYTGIVGQGSFCNGEKLQVSPDTLETGIVAASSSLDRLMNNPPSYILELVKRKIQTATFSGAVYKASLVARGKFVGYIEEKVGPHDMAAVQVIVEEAGGKITGLDGRKLDYRTPFKGAITSNGLVHDELVRLTA